MAINKDDTWQRMIRDRYLVPFYRKHSLNGRYVFIDGNEPDCAVKLQRTFAIDTVVQSHDGNTLCIEEKLERWPGYERQNFALETRSCTVAGKEKDGWMCYAQSDLLLYGFVQEDEQGVDLYVLRFQPLRAWFRNTYQPQHPDRAYILPYTNNHTEIYKVPITSVLAVKGIRAQRYFITDYGIVRLQVRTGHIDLKKIREKLELEKMMDTIALNLNAQSETEIEEEDGS